VTAFLLGAYRLLLYGCPRAVRRAAAAEMEEIFLHCLRIEWARRGWIGRIAAVGRGFADVVVFVIRVRLRTLHPDALRRWPAEQEIAARRPLVIMRDIRGTVRLMRSQPALAAAIVFMFALGIGATTAIFSIVYGVLLRPLPFPEPDRLVQVYGSRPDRGWNSISLTEANFWDMRDRNRVFEEFGAWHGASFSLTGFEFPERVTAGRVSTGFFRALGVNAAAGRIFEPGEDRPGRGEGLVLLSHTFWSRRFGTDTSAVGRALTLDGRSYTIIGILPPGSPWLDISDVFIPFIQRADANRGSFEYLAIGRLKAGVSFDSALADLQRVAKDLEAAYPKDNTGLGATMNPSRRWIASDDLRRTLLILLGAVCLLLVIACVNVTNLLLARASARARDSALRTALGASRLDLVRERLTESLFYSTAGTALGLVVARWMLGTLKSLNPGGIPRLNEVALDGWVMAFAAAMALFVGLVTGLVPALRTPIGDIVRALRAGQRGATGDRAQSRMRGAFVAVEVALSLILLVGAGLLVRSLLTVLSVNRGFQTENRMVMTVNVPGSYGRPRMEQLNAELIARLQNLPGVVSVAAVSGRPMSAGSTGLGIGAADQPDVAGSDVPWATWRIVTSDYFKTMGLPMIAGRNFVQQDLIGKPWRAIVSKRVADALWPGQNPIGRTIILWKGQGNSRGEVIGVVADMRERRLDADPTLAVYFPAYGTAMGSMQIVMHTRGRPQDVIPAARAVVAGLDASLPISNVRTLEEIVTASVATRRMTVMLLVVFAALALVLALAGVYGVLAYSVTRRTSEIGVRLALGAEHRRVLRLVVAQGLRPVIAGAVLGLGATFWLSRLMANLLFEIRPNDPLTYAAVVTAILFVGAIACYIPARRVLRVDPAIALRSE
jgi:putative ABC transport system permease protein